MCCQSGLRTLASAIPSMLDLHQNCFFGISYCCPSHGDSVAMVLQDQSLLALQMVIDGVGVGVG